MADNGGEADDLPRPLREYVVIIEKGETSYGAWVPDLSGCVAAAATADEVEQLFREAIEFHIEGPKASGEEIPEPSSRATSVAILA